jgi:sn-glycerol 3-phosphate transport system substrate-binding protein
MKRFLMILLIFLMVNNIAYAKTILTYWYSLPEKEHQFMDKLVADYNASHAQIEVQNKNFASEKELILALMMEGETPNIALIDPLWTYELVKREKLVALEDLMEKAGSMVSIMAKMDTYKPMIESCSIKSGEKGGILYSYPFFAKAYGLLYNKDLIAKAGLSAAPKTWGELVLFSKKIMRVEPGTYGFYLPLMQSDFDLGNFLRLMFWQGGLQLYNPLSKEIFFNDAEGERVLQFLIDLRSKYGIATSDPNQPVAFKIGTLDELFRAQLEGKPIAAAPLPYRSGKPNRSLSPLKIYALAIFKDEDAKIMERSWNFVAYLREFPQVLFFTKYAPYLPAHKQVALSPEYIALKEAHPGLEAYVNEIAQSPVDLPSLSTQKALKILAQELIKAFEGKCSPSEALQSAAVLLTKILNNPTIPWTELY